MWCKEEKILINQAVTVLADMQKNYGKQINLKSMLKGWELILADKMTGQEVVQAVKKYMEKKSDIPAPADILEIHQPAEKKITYAEYTRAKDEWAKNGYPKFDYYGNIVREYESENTEDTDREPFQITGDMQALIAVKKL